jgi:hypothetical protein
LRLGFSQRIRGDHSIFTKTGWRKAIRSSRSAA